MGAEAWFNPTVGEKGDLRHAAAMTREMFKVSPFYEPVGPGRWLAEIEHHVGVPVGLTSWGPTAEDKRVVTTVSA
jgi:adenylosuccinate synthase